MILMSAVTAILFLGGWLGINIAIKITLICFLFVTVRAAYPRYRYDQLMDLGWKVFLPISLGILLLVGGIIWKA